MKHLLLFLFLLSELFAQTADKASVKTEIGDEGNKLIIEAHGVKPEIPLLYNVEVKSHANFAPQVIRDKVILNFKVLQGKAKVLTVALSTKGRVIRVTGENVKEWAVRKEEKGSFLDIIPKEPGNTQDLIANVLIQQRDFELPLEMEITSFGPAEASGFSAQYLLSDRGLTHRVLSLGSAIPLEEEGKYFAQSEVSLKVEIFRKASEPGPIEFTDAKLVGVLEGDSATFNLQGFAQVRGDEEVTLDVLSGRAAPITGLENLTLIYRDETPIYQLKFDAPGLYPVHLTFVAQVLKGDDESWRSFDFTVPGGAVVPLELSGLPSAVRFVSSKSTVLTNGRGFLPASGAIDLAWQARRETGDSKLFFTSETRTDVSVGAGLLRQTSEIRMKALQGNLQKVTLKLEGSGEILSVEGGQVLNWAVEGGELSVAFSGSIDDAILFVVRSRTALDVLPVKVEPLRLTPMGAVRHSGYLRVFNEGAVRLEVMETSGLTQLSPDQYPVQDQKKARQIFYYRYPSAERAYVVAAARVKPEISLSQVLVYEMSEADRILYADLELDIREAGIREWEFQTPPDYSVVSVTGADVVDYVFSKGRLKVIFANEITGRRLVKLHLEKNEPAKAGEWALPVLAYPGIKSIRGELGVSAAPGFRITSGQLVGLSEIPLAHFQKNGPRMQQVYRMRNEKWTATMKVEALGQNIQADLFHLYSLKEKNAYVSVLLNYFVSGAPVSEWKIQLPAGAENLSVDGQDVRDYRQEELLLTVPLHRPVMGAYQLLITYEQKAEAGLSMGELTPVGTQGERGYVQVVSPGQVELQETSISENLITLDPLELPAEYILLSHAPSLAAWQYNARPFSLATKVGWFARGESERQVIEHARLHSQISREGGVVTEATYYVRSQGERTLQLTVPKGCKVQEVKVDGETVTIRKVEEERLIPLPDSIREKTPIKVEVRSIVSSTGERVKILAPFVTSQTQLTTNWKVSADASRTLKPHSSNGLELVTPVSVSTGFDWISENALLPLLILIFMILLGWRMAWHGSRIGSICGGVLLLLAACGSFVLCQPAFEQEVSSTAVLEYAIPVLTPSVLPLITVEHLEQEQAIRSPLAGFLILVGLVGVCAAWRFQSLRRWLVVGGVFALSCGLLTFASGAGWFFFLLGGFLIFLLAQAILARRDLASVTAAALVALSLGSSFLDAAPRWPAASELHEKWELRGGRVEARSTLKISGEAGEKFLLLHAPGVLTSFEGEGLKVVNEKTNYFVVPESDGTFECSFSYQTPAAELDQGLPLLTTIAAVRTLEIHYEAAGWGIISPAAVRQSDLSPAQGSAAKLWLGPALDARIFLSPRAREVAAEEVRFFVEVDNLFVPGPGVVDGRHRVSVRPSQGQVRDLSVSIPEGFTVGDVRSGLAGPWRFDPETRQLHIEFTSAQSKPFAFLIESQRSLGKLPSKVALAPARIEGSAGEVGMLALAFGQEAQLDRDVPKGLSLVNLADFNAAMLPKGATLQKVYRYSKAAASLELHVAPVAPEVRVTSTQKLSFGDERIVLAVDFTAKISRAGIFRLSFPLPAGLEVESLSGAALNHWVEVEEKKQHIVVMNLNGKTLGEQSFNLVLAGASPALPLANWQVPKLSLREAARDSGQLVVVPGRGIQLQAKSRQDVSALDPRKVGGHQAGALAYRLLQGSWKVGLVVTQLKPSLAMSTFHEMELREAYAKSRVHLVAQVDHASIRNLRVELPELSEADLQTVSASGAEVRDIIQVEGREWEIRFKRRVVGEVKVRIDYLQSTSPESLTTVKVPSARRQESYLAMRPGSQLELRLGSHAGWNEVGWGSLPKPLRQPGAKGVPAKFLRTLDSAKGISFSLRRHAVVSSSRIRVESGRLLSVVSPAGEVMNEAELTLEMIQRGSLELSLPAQSRLFGVFVNGESAMVVRKGEGYLFKVVGAAGGKTAQVRVYYSTQLASPSLENLSLQAFKIGEPLENIEWVVSLPESYRLKESEGDLDLQKEGGSGVVEEGDYLALAAQQKRSKQDSARGRLSQVSSLLKGGYNGRAAIALEQVSNQASLDAASNEDARVQFENVVTQQAVLGLNTRLQRNYLDNKSALGAGFQNVELESAANFNPVFEGNLNYRPDDFSKVVMGNAVEVNRAIDTIASKWVKHQRVMEPVSQMLEPVVSGAGRNYVFHRTIQVSGDSSLELALELEKESAGENQRVMVFLLLVLLALFIGFGVKKA